MNRESRECLQTDGLPGLLAGMACGASAHVGYWDTVLSGTRLGGGPPVGSTRNVGRGDGRLQLVFSCSSGDETGRLDLEELRQK